METQSLMLETRHKSVLVPVVLTGVIVLLFFAHAVGRRYFVALNGSSTVFPNADSPSSWALPDGDYAAIDFAQVLADLTGNCVRFDSRELADSQVTIVAPIREVNYEIMRAILAANQILISRIEVDRGFVVLALSPANRGWQIDPEARLIVYSDVLSPGPRPGGE